MLYDPDDANQSLYKGNFAKRLPFTQIVSIGLVRGLPVQRTISDPRGISYEEYQQIDKDAVIAFGNHGTKTEGIWPDGLGSTCIR